MMPKAAPLGPSDACDVIVALRENTTISEKRLRFLIWKVRRLSEPEVSVRLAEECVTAYPR
jgi:hypothetical protein